MDFRFPQHVHLGQGLTQRFGVTAKEVGARVLLLTEEDHTGSPDLTVLTESLDRSSVPFLILTKQPGRSLRDTAKEALTVAKASRMDILATFGDSETISLGRSIAAEIDALSPIACLEVPVAICDPLWFRPEGFLSTGHPSDSRFFPFSVRRPHHIFLDPHLGTEQTPKAAVSGLLEALFYAVELVLRDQTTLMHQGLLLTAIEALWSSLKRIYENPAHVLYRLTALEAGFNISVAQALGPRPTGVSFAFTLAGLAGLPPASMAALLLAPLLEGFSSPAGERLLAVARAFQVPGDGKDLGPRIAQEVRRFLHAHKLPLRLQDFQLVESQLNQAVDVVRGLDLRRSGVLDPEQLPELVRLAR